MIDEALQRELVRDAARSPSVHNVQPTRFRFTSDGVVLFRALERALPVGDPTGRDIRASLGAAFEGLSLALSMRGMRLGLPTPERDATAAGCEPVVRAMIERGGDRDPLAPWLTKRRSHRGKFDALRPEDASLLAAPHGDDAIVVTDRDALRTLAGDHDRATWAFESRRDYHEELWRWLRLSPSDPRWFRDGLNADCLALSAIERAAARQLLVPSRFALLTRLSVARALVSEAPQVKSAAAALLFCPVRTLDAFDVGRRFHRLWLELTALGLVAVPMSASADDDATRTMLEQRFGVSVDRRLVNVLRVGRANTPPASARLPIDELLV